MTFRGLSLVALLALGAGTLGAASAYAEQVAVMVPPRSDQMAADEIAEDASEELARLLRGHELGVISPQQASAAAEGHQSNGAFSHKYDPLHCITPECAEEYRKLFAAKLAAQLSVASKQGRATNISVVLTESATAFYAASAPVEGNDVKGAVREAFELAYSKLRRGAGPWLTITGTPKRANVYVDDVELGELPIDKRHLTPGTHRIEIRAPDYANDVHTVHVPNSLEHEERLFVDLQRVQRQPLTTYEPRPSKLQRSAWDWALGSAFAAAGSASLIAGIYNKTQGGDCTARQDGMCTHFSESGGPHDNLMIGLGAAGMTIGGLIMGFGPIGSVSVHADRQRALLELKGTF